MLDEKSHQGFNSYLARVISMYNLVPRVLSYPPYGARERERERPWKTLVTCLPESGRLQTNDLGEGQVSVRFVSTERRRVSAAIKLC